MALKINHNYTLTENEVNNSYTTSYARVRSIKILGSEIKNDGVESRKDIKTIILDLYKDKATRDIDVNNFFEHRLINIGDNITTIAGAYAEIKKVEPYKNGVNI